MKRKFLTALLMAGLVMIDIFQVAVVAKADVICEPYDDNYYEQYREEYVYNGRNYFANGEQGRISGYNNQYDWAYVWSYPRAEDFMRMNMDSPVTSEISTSMTYADEDGLTWNYLNCYMGYRNGWICVDKPQEENLPVREIKYENIVETEIAEHSNGVISDQNEQNLWQTFVDLRFEIKVIIGLVLAIIVATIILMKIMWNNREDD